LEINQGYFFPRIVCYIENVCFTIKYVEVISNSLLRLL